MLRKTTTTNNNSKLLDPLYLNYSFLDATVSEADWSVACCSTAVLSHVDVIVSLFGGVLGVPGCVRRGPIYRRY